MAVQAQYYHDPDSLSGSLRQVARRLAGLRRLRLMSLGAFIGVCVSIVSVILGHLDLIPDWLMLEIFIPFAIILGAAVGLVIAVRRPVPLMEAARLTEVRLGLKERLSSALEFEGYGSNPRDQAPSILVQMQQRDAAAYARAVHPKQAAPFRMPWEMKAFFISLVVLILAIVIPNLPMFVSPGLALERAIVAKSGDKMVQSAKLIEHQADVQQLPKTKWAAQQMKRLGQQMQRGHMDKRQAMVKYSKLTAQMQAVQKQLAGGAGDSTKSLAAAGQQLQQSLQSNANPNNGEPSNSPKANNGGQGQNASGANGRGAGKPGEKNNGRQHGFNVPSFNNGKNANGQNANHAQSGSATREIQKAAQALQHGDVSSLSQQLRQLANRVQSGQMSAQEKQQTQQDLQKLADALKGSPLKETQQHAQNAADAMKQGDTQKAADEMRKAADAAEREMRQQQDQNGMQDAQKSLQNSQQQMASANSPSEVSQQSQSGQQSSGQQGQSDNGGQGDSSGQDSGQGDSSGDTKSAEQEMKRQGGSGGKGDQQGPSGDNPGEENGGSGSANRAGHGGGHPGKGPIKSHYGKFQGPPNKLNPNFDPSKFPKYAKIYLGKPGSGGRQGRLGALIKTRPGAGPAHPADSRVPVYSYVGDAERAAEHAVDNEDIPPAYKDSIHKYFDSLTPTQK